MNLNPDQQLYPAQPHIAAPQQLRRGPATAAATVMAVAGAVIAAAAFLPWIHATVGSETVSLTGTDSRVESLTDGWITLGCGIVLAVLGMVLAVTGRKAMVFAVAILAALVAAGLAAYDTYSALTRVDSALGPAGHASVGIGLWLTGIGAVAAIVAGMVFKSMSRRS